MAHKMSSIQIRYFLIMIRLLFTGITLNTLWMRLQERKPDFSLKIDEECKEYLWSSVISRHDGLSFFELQTSRPDLAAVNRMRSADPITGVITEEQHNVSYEIGVIVYSTYVREISVDLLRQI